MSTPARSLAGGARERHRGVASRLEVALEVRKDRRAVGIGGRFGVERHTVEVEDSNPGAAGAVLLHADLLSELPARAGRRPEHVETHGASQLGAPDVSLEAQRDRVRIRSAAEGDEAELIVDLLGHFNR